jgi:uncharacterized membrane protein
MMPRRLAGAGRPPIIGPLLTGQDIAHATAELRAAHERETSGLQRAVDRLTALAGLPGFVAVLALGVFVWIAGDQIAPLLGVRPWDPAPYADLQLAAGLGSLFIAALILTTQRREDKLQGHRAQLILELAILNDQKTSKIIELLEEGRRDNPMITNRVDVEALAMSTPSDPQAVLDAIKDPPGE